MTTCTQLYFAAWHARLIGPTGGELTVTRVTNDVEPQEPPAYQLAVNPVPELVVQAPSKAVWKPLANARSCPALTAGSAKDDGGPLKKPPAFASCLAAASAAASVAFWARRFTRYTWPPSIARPAKAISTTNVSATMTAVWPAWRLCRTSERIW